MAASEIRRSARRRWTIQVFAAAVFVVLTALLLFEVLAAREDALRAAAAATERLDRALADHARETVSAVRAVLATVAAHLGSLESLGRLRPDDAAAELALGVRGLPYLKGVTYFGPDGRLLASSLPGPAEPADVSDRDYFLAHRDGSVDPIVGRPVRSPQDGGWVVPLSHRVELPGGRFGGVLVAVVDPRHFQDFYEALQIGRNGAVALYSRGGDLLFRVPYDDGLVGAPVPQGPPLRDLVAKSPAGTYRARTSIDGVDRIVSYRVIEDLSLVALVGSSTEEVLAEWWTGARNHVLVWFGAGLGLAGLTVLLLRRERREERAERALREAYAQKDVLLAEKDMLLREVHHRVRNNLQGIWAILRLEGARLGHNPEARDRIEAIAERIQAMGRIHQELYRSGDLARIDLGAYLESVARGLLDLHGRSRDVRLDVEAEAVASDVDTALPLGLITNELTANALKHAFPDGRAGTLRIVLRRDGAGRVELTVLDDGVGHEPDEGKRGMGMLLVAALAQQIGARWSVDGGGGTTAAFSFPEPGPGPGLG
jgi:two-component sensor histidine kinase